MKRFLVWLFDYRCRDCVELKKEYLKAIEGIDAWCKHHEMAMSEMDASHSKDIGELQERLEMPKRRGPSGRPFSVLAKIAEQGERARKP